MCRGYPLKQRSLNARFTYLATRVLCASNHLRRLVVSLNSRQKGACIIACVFDRNCVVRSHPASLSHSPHSRHRRATAANSITQLYTRVHRCSFIERARFYRCLNCLTSSSSSSSSASSSSRAHVFFIVDTCVCVCVAAATAKLARPIRSGDICARMRI